MSRQDAIARATGYFDDGGLACRKLCSQDSDCTDPFGLVCVNPGFGFGVCIGQAPCQ